jgi:polyhydroxybutyrate depolymerase
VRILAASFSAFFVALGIVGCTPSAAQTPIPAKPPGRYVETISVDGAERSYILRVPKAYDGTRALPLVVVLHGFTASGALAEVYTGFGQKSEQEGFFMVAPDGVGNPRGWNSGFLNLTGRREQDDVKFVGALLDKMERDLNVDRDRIYIAGHSNGAMMANLLASRLSDRIAAIGAVAGTTGLAGGTQRVPDPQGPVSVILIHGKKDNVVAYDDSSQAFVRTVSAPNSAKWWADQIGAKGPVRTKLNDDNILIDTWENGRNGTRVTLVSIVNGTHDWPGGMTVRGPETLSGISGVDMIWEFFRANPKRR